MADKLPPALTPSPKPVPIPTKPFPMQVLSEVTEREVTFLWRPYVPIGGLTILIGDGGYGKSTLVASIAADLSTGRALPGQEARPPQKVLMFGTEDGVDTIIKKKMREFNADEGNILVYEEPFYLTEATISRIRATVIAYNATCVFLDPFVSYAGGDVDFNRSNEVRSVTRLLDSIAKDTGTAILIVHHVRKQSGGKDQHKALGTADFINGFRSALLVDQTKRGQFYMKHVKHNWTGKGPALAYSWDEGKFNWEGEFNWEDNKDDSRVEVSITPRGRAETFLHDLLKNGPVPAADILELAHKAGLAERTLNRAKLAIAVSERIKGVRVWNLRERVGMGGLPLSMVTLPDEPIDKLLEEAKKRMVGRR